MGESRQIAHSLRNRTVATLWCSLLLILIDLRLSEVIEIVFQSYGSYPWQRSWIRKTLYTAQKTANPQLCNFQPMWNLGCSKRHSVRVCEIFMHTKLHKKPHSRRVLWGETKLILRQLRPAMIYSATSTKRSHLKFGAAADSAVCTIHSFKVFLV